jgi:hypothetical protein
MGNWRQIQGRIRRARTSADPAAKLGELFQKTRDAMVAFEAGAVEEKSGRSDEAVRWYTIAAQRFRRADWRQKAAEALTRLGAAVPEETPQAQTAQLPAEDGDVQSVPGPELDAESDVEAAERRLTEPPSEIQPTHPASASSAARTAGERPRRRRGRRGGRRHRRGGEGEAGARRTGVSHPHAAAHHQQQESLPTHVSEEEPEAVADAAPAASEGLASAAARFVPEPTGPFVERSTYIRAGDPALASRFAHLESLLRRLISAPLRRMDDLGEAPAGPGVFLLSDSDMTSNYYVEACQTLRIGVGQVARAGRAGRGARSEGKAALRAQLAEHLGISDAQVTDYLRKHCVVRWMQLDEDAPHLAHFAIALLRPALNVE